MVFFVFCFGVHMLQMKQKNVDEGYSVKTSSERSSFFRKKLFRKLMLFIPEEGLP